MKEIVILECDEYCEGFPSSNLIEFIEWANKILASIPSEYRDSTYIMFEPDGPSIQLRVAYEIPRPKSEISQQNQAEVESAIQAAIRATNRVEKLKKAYGLSED